MTISNQKFRLSTLRLGTVLACASFGLAHAATYSYTPNNAATDVWSAGTDWTDGVTTPLAPVSSLDTSLVFGPVANFPDAAILTNTNTNDLGAFSLNSLTLQGVGTLTTGFPTSITIASAAGSSLNFVTNSGSVAPTINLAATNGPTGSAVSYNVTSAITLGNNLSIAGNGNASFTFSGPISGAAGITKTGTSALTLSGTNTYTGNTAINGGAIKISAANNLGDNTQATNTIEMTGGLLESTAGTYDLGANRVITLNGASTIQSDAGILTLSGAINKGGNSLTLGGAGGFAVSGAISGTAGGITKTGAGTATLTGLNTYVGLTTINGGILNLGSAGALGGGGNVTFTGGTLQYSPTNTSDLSSLIVNSATAGQPVKVDVNGQTVTYASPIAASNTTGFNLIGTGGGTLALNAANNYVGTTTLTSGTLKAGNTLAFGATTNPLTLSGGTLDLATDTSIGAYNTTVNGATTIASDKATATSAGITHTLGTLSIAGVNLTAIAGANAISGTPAIAFGATTLTGGATFTANTASISLGSVTGANFGATFGGTSTAGSSVGAIGLGTGTLTKSGTGLWTFAGPGTYTGATALSGGTSVVAADGAFGTGVLNFNNTGTILQGNGTAHTITNPTVNVTTSGFIIGGTSDLTFTGQVNYTAGSGNRDLNFNGTGNTIFSGGWVMSSATSTRTDLLQGPGNVTIDSVIQPLGTATTTQQISYAGSGVLTLSAAHGGSVAGAGTGTGLIQVGTGATLVANQGTAPTVKISGNYTIGSSGAAALVVKGGNGTTTGQGTLSLVDGTINTLTINNTAANATVLTFAGTAGNGSSKLNMEVGGTSDTITLGSTLKISPLAGGTAVNITGLGGLSGTQQTLITAPGGVTGNGASFSTFTLGSTSGDFGGRTVSLGTDTTHLYLVESAATATPTTAYWTGVLGSGGNATWGTFTGGNANNTNWAGAATGGDTHQVPGGVTNVVFSANTSANSNIALSANTTVNSLEFNSAAAPVTIGGSVLTLSAGSGSGITLDSGSAAQVINSGVALGAAQTWTNSSSSPLTVNGVISGAFGLTKAGTGALVLGGSNTFTGVLGINDGIVRVGAAGALNTTTPVAVTFGSSAPSTADLQIGGINTTIGGLATNATPGTPIVENASATPAQLSVTQNTNSTYAGVIQDGTGGGALSFRKSGTGTLTVSGTNTYTGVTTVANGDLQVNGSLAAGSAVNVTASADNRTAILGGTGTIGGSVDIATPTGTGRVNEITGGDIGTTGALAIGGGLTLDSGAFAALDIIDNGANDRLNITGGLTLNTGSSIRVTGGLTTPMTYTLITYTGSDPSLSGYSFTGLDGNALGSNYAFTATGGVLSLTISATNAAVPTINITSPIGGSRVMKGQTVSIGGSFGNSGSVNDLHGTLSDNGGALTVTGITPSGSTTVAAGGSHPYTASVNSGTVLGSQGLSIKVSDPAASPISASANSTLDVLDNRTVNASAVPLGSVHVNATATGSTSLTSVQPDNQYTEVTVNNGGPDVNGISVSGGNTATVFNGTNSDGRTVTGAFTSLGNKSGTVTLVTNGEGLAGEAPINVGVGYTAQVFSGTAAYALSTNGSWGTAANWHDTNAADLNGAGAPGLDGTASIGDTATFGDVAGAGATTVVSLNGANPSLAALTFNATSTAYTIATGSGGSLSLQNAATSVNVAGTTTTISAPIGGLGGLDKSGSGTLVLSSGSNSYAGATAVESGVVQLTASSIPATSAVTLGSGSNSGALVLGGAGGAISDSVVGIATSGTGLTNKIVGGNASASTLTVNLASGIDTFGGTIGGTGTNENSLALTKQGAGTLVLSNSPTYTGTTTITQGVLQTPLGSDLAGFITFPVNVLATYGVWQTSGTITKTLSTTSASGNLNWAAFNGFAAKGGPLTLALNGGAQLTWGGNGFMGSGGSTMVLGSTTANNQVTLPNAINLASTDNFQRPIYVESGAGGDSAVLSGVLSPGAGSTGISKQGGGLLILSGANTYTGSTLVTAGTLQIANPNGLGYGGLTTVSNVSSGANSTTVSSGATVDLNGQSGVLESITLNGTGVGGVGSLINSNASTPASINVGLTSIGIAGNAATPYTTPYTTATVAITGGGGSGATGTVALGTTPGTSAITLTNVGSGYTSVPTVTITGDGAGATATATISSVNLASTSSIGGAGDITVNAPVLGTGALTKVGAGKLIFTAANGYTGGTTVTGGVLDAENSTALGTGPITLSGGSLVIGSSSILTLNASAMTLNGGATIKMDLGSLNASDLIALTGVLTKGSAGTYFFDFGNTGAPSSTYTLATFASTTFLDASGFGALNLSTSAGSGSFVLTPTSLSFVTVPEPGTVFMGLMLVGIIGLRLRKRMNG